MNKFKHIGRDVVVNENALTEEQCDILVDILFENLKKQEEFSKETGKYSSNTNYHSLPIHKSRFPKAYNLLSEQMKNAVIAFKEINGLDCELGNVFENFEFMRYEKNGGVFDAHCDSNGASHPRTIALIWYLNDMEEGGELKIHGRTNPLTITPRKGKMVVFPTDWTHYHEVTTPTSSERYSINAFIRYE